MRTCQNTQLISYTTDIKVYVNYKFTILRCYRYNAFAFQRLQVNSRKAVVSLDDAHKSMLSILSFLNGFPEHRLPTVYDV